MYQVVGEQSVESPPAKAEVTAESAVSEEDVKLVASQARTSKERAREALLKTKGDIAEAIISLTS